MSDLIERIREHEKLGNEIRRLIEDGMRLHYEHGGHEVAGVIVSVNDYLPMVKVCNPRTGKTYPINWRSIKWAYNKKASLAN